MRYDPINISERTSVSIVAAQNCRGRSYTDKTVLATNPFKRLIWAYGLNGVLEIICITGSSSSIESNSDDGARMGVLSDMGIPTARPGWM